MKSKMISALAVHELKTALNAHAEALLEVANKNPDAPKDVMDAWLESLQEVRALRDFLMQPHCGTRLQLIEEAKPKR